MATGFFGKLPLRGDFVTRGLPSGARAVVDRWLTGILAPLARLPEAWPEDGLRGLITHGEGVLALLILPSRDKSGRAFPLAAVSWVPQTGQAQVDAWADQILPALRRASRGDLDADDLFALLERQQPPADGTAPSPPLIWAKGLSPVDPAAFLQQMDQN
ncbi:type VI secretion system-associated protein TagF [Paracoccus marinaquae]|uniref:Type VI secretion system-associated protein TagF n=1 Tax=Paracoccus marinaquae TaxID=2841926 RepID=A0ABS6APG2_9RHOB|nr:type VI secretion system-associated protein TagF [Paracoccus marinaquae]MBU3031510.1 type VI secretion system-associated protein TagF [Paracoccus marinaquae]